MTRLGGGEGGGSLETCLPELVKSRIKDRKQIYLNCLSFKQSFTLVVDWCDDITYTGQLMVFVRGTGNAFQVHEGFDSSCSARDASTGEVLFLKLTF